MISKILKLFFGSSNDRTLTRLNKLVAKINALEPSYQKLTDEELRAKTPEFKQRLIDGESLQSIAVEAFATVREASIRTLNMRPFDVQIIGAFVLCENSIAEMKTGEGKTLTSTLAIYLHALMGEGVHVITVNEYLAKRDASNNTPLFNFLGISVAVNISMMSPSEKIAAYKADVTYGTNSEFGFDYLRDNLIQSVNDRVQRKLYFAIIDEVDSILIDEARTPLVISGAAEENVSLYQVMNQVIPQLIYQDKEDSKEYTGTGDYTINLKSRQAFLTERGQFKCQTILAQMGIIQDGESLYSVNNSSALHHLMAALRAHSLFEKDVHYIVKDGEILIIDEHTGRTMEGRRWGEGNHQAVEAKEGVQVRSENVTIASISYQNYFRLYHKLSGMTGTADTEAFEFQQIYGLDTIVIPTNKPITRKDKSDILFKTEAAKFKAILKEIKERTDKHQPILVGTASVEKSEALSEILKKEGIKHSVLNAKFHAQEADIIAQAGAPGAVTIATNMAGRGTDIILGGNLLAKLAKLPNLSDEEKAKEIAEWEKNSQLVKDAGGLHIIGTERHESRRIDNQLRGRAGRQGDAGSSRFFLSLEDNLLKIFIPEARLQTLAKSFQSDDDFLDMKIMSRIIASAQAKLESHNFDIRKQLIEYDDVANQQRSVIYSQRNYLLEHEDISPIMEGIISDVTMSITEEYLPSNQIIENWNIEGFKERVHQEFGFEMNVEDLIDAGADSHQVAENLEARIREDFAKKREQVGDDFNLIQKSVLLKNFDDSWREQIHFMDDLRKSIHLRGYAQKDPKQEYKKESFAAFEQMLNRINIGAIGLLTKIQFELREPEQIKKENKPFSRLSSKPGLSIKTKAGGLAHQNKPSLESNFHSTKSMADSDLDPNGSIFKNVSRNELCPCGSGERFKHCHGKL